MSTGAGATLQTIWDCRWSVPEFRPIGGKEHRESELSWICVRSATRKVTEEKCEHCPFWEALLPRH
jgi:hypothetical protein